jgi:hypothetical protein
MLKDGTIVFVSSGIRVNYAEGVRQLQPRMKSWDQVLLSTSIPCKGSQMEDSRDGSISSKTLDSFDLLNQTAISVSL